MNPTPSPARSILIVDDDQNLSKTLSAILSARGYAPTRASTGRDALRRIRNEPPHICLIDLRLGDTSGVELLRKVRELAPETECIVVTGHASQASAIEAINLGAYSYVVKPYDMDRLLLTIRRAIEKQDAIRALRESERKLRGIVEQSADGIVLTDEQGAIIEWNHGLEEITGLKRTEVLGQPLWDVQFQTLPKDQTNPASHEQLRASIRQYLSTGQALRSGQLEEHDVLRFDGLLRTTQTLSFPIETDEGFMVGGIVRDITARRRAEEELDRVFGLSLDLICVANFDGALKRMNPAFEITLGYSREELADRLLSGFVHPEDRDSFTGEIQRLSAGTPGVYFENRWICKDGSVKWLAWRFVSVPSEKVVYAVARDVTERKQFEQTLQRQVEELTVLEGVARAGAEATDENTLIERATQVMDRLLDADELGVMMLNEVTGVLHAHPAYLGHERASIPPIALGQGLIGQVAMDGKPRRGWECGTMTPPVTRSSGESAPRGHSELCVPLKAGRRVLGVVCTLAAKADAFSDGDERLLATLASQLATAIEKVRLMQTLRRRVSDRMRELSALYDVTALANESLDVDKMLDRSLSRALVAIESTVGSVFLLDETGSILRLAAHQGLSTDIVAKLDGLPMGSGLAGWVAEHGELVAVPDVWKDPRAIDAVRRTNERAYLGVPVQVQGRATGVLSVSREAERPFTMEEIALVSSIADHVGVLVENARLRRQAERTAVIEERERLARELHDSVTQSLYSVSLLANAGRKLGEAGNFEQASKYLPRLGEIAQHALGEMRLLVYELRPSALKQVGLVAALHHRLEIVERRANIVAHIAADELPVALPSDVEQGLYRIAQEALNNVLKHSGATAVTVRIQAEKEWIELEVSDNGQGFDPKAVSDRSGMGLIGMRERAEKMGGELEVITGPEKGTRVRVVLSVVPRENT